MKSILFFGALLFGASLVSANGYADFSAECARRLEEVLEGRQVGPNMRKIADKIIASNTNYSGQSLMKLSLDENANHLVSREEALSVSAECREQVAFLRGTIEQMCIHLSFTPGNVYFDEFVKVLEKK